MNPNARPFQFNPNTQSFVPGGQPPPPQQQQQGYYAQQQGNYYNPQQQQQGYYQQPGAGQPNYYNHQQAYGQQQGGYQQQGQQQQQYQQRQQYQNQQPRQNQQQQPYQQQQQQQQRGGNNQQQQRSNQQQQQPQSPQNQQAATQQAAQPKKDAPVLTISARPAATSPTGAAKPATAGFTVVKHDEPAVSPKQEAPKDDKVEQKNDAAEKKEETASAPAPAPAPAAAEKKDEGASGSWEDIADKKEEKPVAAAADDEKPADKTPDTPSKAASSSSSSLSVAELTKAVDNIAIDAEEAAELAAAEAEDKEASEAALAKKIAVTTAYAQRKAHDEREHINIVFIGHVDAGKSTISGQVLLLTGQVDERTIAKYEKEAKEKNRESWYLAYVMDTNEEERAKGKTVEVGRAHFTTAKKRYTLLDAPGHKNYVPNMIGGASQADVGVLVISARKGEFETGFDRGGQTREHAMLAKTLGLSRLIVLVNKMDDPTVKWDQARFDEIESKLTPFLKKCGFNMKTDVFYCPASGYTGQNIRDPVTVEAAPWVKDRRSLFQILDDLPPMPRDPAGGLRLPIVARYKDMGALFVLGKLESGTLVKDTKLLMMPNKIEVQCIGITVDEVEVDCAKPGENVIVKIKGIEEEDVQEGFVLSYSDRPTRRSAIFEGQIAVLELLDHKPIMTIGYSAVLHVHSVAVECVISSIVNEIDRKTGEPAKTKPKFLKSQAFANVRIKLEQTIAIENFKDFPALGRFTLRDEGKTIAIGKIMKMKDS